MFIYLFILFIYLFVCLWYFVALYLRAPSADRRETFGCWHALQRVSARMTRLPRGVQ